jgi:sialate O-acetylesterase
MKLAAIFGDHAVLQREMPAPVWGWTRPLAQVSVKLGPYEACGMAGDDGKFLVRLPPMPAGGPYELEATAADGGGTATSVDVMVGEVWLASGQSNMEWTLMLIGAAGQQEAATAGDPLLRMLNVPREARLGRQSDVRAAWQRCAPPATREFSAVGYYFARRLRAELGVAVGILHSSWGGTLVEAWISREWLVRNEHAAHWVAAYEAEVHSPAYWDHKKEQRPLSDFFPADPGNGGEKAGWAKPAHPEGDWKEVVLPRAWQFFGHNHSGVFWFRKTLDIPASWAGKDLSLQIGAVDKQDVTYFNGEPVGATGSGFEQEFWNVDRDYRVPGRLVKAGPNTIAVRAYSFAYYGGLIGPAISMRVALRDASEPAISLAGNWRYKVEHDLGLVSAPAADLGPGNANSPYILYDSMIAPLAPAALRGAIWYQGESNANRASEYRGLLTDLIRCWRRDFGVGDFAFLTVQLANYMGEADYQHESSWARLREAQLQTLAEPATGLAVTIDIGEATDIHPKNKQDVGGRLAQWALGKTYGRPVCPSGPLYRSLTIEGARIRLSFAHTDGGLVARGGALKTFYIAGAERRFVSAEAVIEGDTIVVSSPDVTRPLAVRYAWADNPAGCNLYNAAGLPASPFRTDGWA